MFHVTLWNPGFVPDNSTMAESRRGAKGQGVPNWELGSPCPCAGQGAVRFEFDSGIAGGMSLW